MAVEVACYDFGLPAATGSVGYTGLGFQPKGLYMINGLCPTDNITDFSFLSVGICDSGLTQSVAEYGNSTGTFIKRNAGSVVAGTSSGNLTIVIGAVTSLDADGFTINYTSANAGLAGRRVRVVAFGGDDVESAVSSPTVVSGAVTGLSFRPELAMAVSIGATGATTFSTTSRGSVGMVNNRLEEFNMSMYGGDNLVVGNDQVESILQGTGFCQRVDQGASVWRAEIDSFDSAGISWSVTGTTPASTDIIDILLLRVGGSRTKVATYLKDNAAAPVTQAVPVDLYNPVLHMALSANRDTETLAGLTSPGASFGIGCMDDGSESSLMSTYPNNTVNRDNRDSGSLILSGGAADATVDWSGSAQVLAPYPRQVQPEIIWSPNSGTDIIVGHLSIESKLAYNAQSVL